MGQSSTSQIFSYLPFSQASVLIRESDVGLVSLQPGIYKVSFPSKVSTYLNLGLPLLVLVESESALADLTNENGLGIVPTQPTKSGIAKALRELIGRGSELDSVALDWYETNWSTKANHQAWLRLLSDSNTATDYAKLTEYENDRSY